MTDKKITIVLVGVVGLLAFGAGYGTGSSARGMASSNEFYRDELPGEDKADAFVRKLKDDRYRWGYADAARQEFSRATIAANDECKFLSTENKAWHCAAAGCEESTVYGCKEVLDSMSKPKKRSIIKHSHGLSD